MKNEWTTVLQPFNPGTPGWAGALTKERLTGTTTRFIWAGCPSCHSNVSKHYSKTQWFGRLLFYRHDISTWCLTNSVKTLKELQPGMLQSLWINSDDLSSLTTEHHGLLRVLDVNWPSAANHDELETRWSVKIHFVHNQHLLNHILWQLQSTHTFTHGLGKESKPMWNTINSSILNDWPIN